MIHTVNEVEWINMKILIMQKIVLNGESGNNNINSNIETKQINRMRF